MINPSREPVIMEFVYTRTNPNYRYGDLDKSHNSEYFVRGHLDSYLAGSDGKALAIVFSNGGVFSKDIKDVKVLPFDTNKQDDVVLLGKVVKSNFLGHPAYSCDQCGTEHGGDRVVSCGKCGAVFKGIK